MNNELSIDPHRLEEEWMRQPLLYEKYADLAREADEEFQEAKESLEHLKAALDGKIRGDFESYGMKKLTEGGLSNTILVQSEYTDSLMILNQARATSLKAKNIILALEQRKYALQNLVELWKGQYFSTPRESTDIEGGKRFLEEVEKKQDEKSDQLRDGFKRKRKKR